MAKARAVIFANGVVDDPGAAKALLQDGDLLVAADGGLHHLQRMGLSPHILIGDMDSISGEELVALEKSSIRVLRYPREKNETDLELAITYVLRDGYRAILVVGALGGRLDHSLANLMQLARTDLAGCNLRINDGREEAFLITSSAVVEGCVGDVVSLLPLLGTAENITTSGLEYPLLKETLFPEKSRGISNVMTADSAEVSLEGGALLCIHTASGQEAYPSIKVAATYRSRNEKG